MKSVLAYVRSLLGWCEDEPAIRTSCKRDRVEDDFSSDDDSPALKRLKHVKRTSFPDIMASNDPWGKDENSSRKYERYVPIHPSTSTPNEVPTNSNRIRLSRNGPSTPTRKPRIHTPVNSVTHAVIDDEDDDQEVTCIESKSDNKPPTYINLVEENEQHSDESEVIYVRKKVKSPPPIKPYKYFNKNSSGNISDSKEDTVYYKFIRKDRNTSPKIYSKFKAPAGVTKTYKKLSTPLPKWMQTSKPLNLPNLRNQSSNHNGTGRSTLSEVFNLDEKKNYQDLIRRFAGSMKSVSFSKPLDIINLAEDSASFRYTQRAQKKALDEIKLIERGLMLDKENENTKEYDPITVASINSSDSEIEIVPSESSTSSVRIDPVNSLKDSLRDQDVTADDWLAKLDTKYRKKKQDTQEKLRDARRESDIISKVNSEQKIAHLEHKLKYELSIPESLLEEPQQTVEMPPFTPEQEKLVKKSLGPGPSGQLLIEKFNLRIHRRDLQTLTGMNWLNDEVINFYMNLLMQRSAENPQLPRVYATNTFFYPKLRQAGHAGLRRWTRKVDIFAYDIMYVPIHLGVHWCLSIVDFRVKKISYLDSMAGCNQACLDALLQYLHDEHKDKKGKLFDDRGWKTECLKDIPQQMNGSDCGMFLCTFAEFSSRNAPFTFSQAHMPYLRRKIALEILLGKLLL